MEIYDVRRWHWMGVGSVVGLLIGYNWSIMPTDQDSVMRVPLMASQFVEAIEATRVSNQEHLRDIVIYSPSGTQQLVIGQVLKGSNWIPFSIYVPFPFRGAIGSSPHELEEYLTRIGISDKSFLVSHMHLELRRSGPIAGAIIGLTLIGGLWPICLQVFASTGLGRKQSANRTDNLNNAPTNIVTSVPAAPELDNSRPRIEETIEKAEITDGKSSPTTCSQPADLSVPTKEPSVPLFEEDKSSKQERQDYRGEYYPVAHTTRREDKKGFSMAELLVVIGIISILISLLLPTLRRSRQAAAITSCANNLHQVSIAMQIYLNDNQGVFFWRSGDINAEGMDWYVYGGQETNNLNLGQKGLFNHVIPRPLNRYLANQFQLFHCPVDDAAPWTLNQNDSKWPAPTEFDWVGNSYNFNANGYPLRPPPRQDQGLDGIKITNITNATQTIAFYDACLYWGYDWHYAHKASIAFVDGHIEFLPLPDEYGEFHWNP